MSTHKNIKSALESLLFVWGDPLEAKVAADLFNTSVPDMLLCFRELMGDYEARESGLRIREIDKSFQLCTNPENDDYIQRLCTPIKEKRLSQAAMEVLAIIAYRQPVTKGEVDSIRGVKSDRVLEGLIRKELVKECGRSSVIGRPILYGTTSSFLSQFGFETLEDLPEIEDIGNIVLSDNFVNADELMTHQISITMESEQREVKDE